MKEKLLNNKKAIIICIIALLVIIGIVVAIIVVNSNKEETKEPEQQTTEKSSLNPDDINIDEDETEKEKIPTETYELASYDGYWFNINDLRDYIAIREIKDNNLVFDLFLYRLFGMENVKVKLNDNSIGDFKYNDDGVKIEGTISVNNQEINLEIKKSTFEYLKKGDKYKFNVQMKKKEFEEHMMKIAEGENK